LRRLCFVSHIGKEEPMLTAADSRCLVSII
jgi:hypothetical protein